MEPCSGAVGGESVAAASCVGGRPTGLGFRPVLATAASEMALAARNMGLPDLAFFFCEAWNPFLLRGIL